MTNNTYDLLELIVQRVVKAEKIIRPDQHRDLFTTLELLKQYQKDFPTYDHKQIARAIYSDIESHLVLPVLTENCLKFVFVCDLDEEQQRKVDEEDY